MIKVHLNSGVHSAGRGVGYYAQFLGEAIKKLSGITLTDKDPDIIHYPFFDLFYPTLPSKKNTPTVVTVHDLTPLVLPKLYPKGVKGSINLLRQYLSLRGVRAIITDSENSKIDIVKLFHFSPKKVFVTPLAVDPIFSKKVDDKQLSKIKKQYHLPDKFVLCVSSPNPNKNLPALAEVTKELGVPLVLVGKSLLQEVKTPVHPELKDLVRIREYSHIVYPGFVPTEDLLVMYKLATLYCQPSLYEGFGLPILEAMTAGCLISCSDISSFPEIYAPNTLTFNPSSLEDMKRIINKALSLTPSEKKEYITVGLRRS